MHAVRPERQLTLDIKPHPVMLEREHPLITGSLKLKGSIRVDRDLNAGNRLAVIVQDADGRVLAQHDAEVEYVTPKPIKDRGVRIGTERVHHATIQ